MWNGERDKLDRKVKKLHDIVLKFRLWDMGIKQATYIIFLLSMFDRLIMMIRMIITFILPNTHIDTIVVAFYIL